MISYYTAKKYIPKDKKLIEYVDIYFNAWAVMNGLTEEENKWLSLIDHSRLTDQIDRIITPFGVGHYSDISTGCKALILLSHLGNGYVVNIQECGQNVINEIFYKLDNVSVYSPRYKLIPTLNMGVCIDDKKLETLEDLSKHWR